MRKMGYILFAVIFCLLIIELKGQNATAPVRLEIVLHPVLNLTVNPAQQVTTLEYRTLEDYHKGVEMTIPEQLSVYSTDPYVVNVRLANEQYKKTTGDTEQMLYLPNVRVRATPVNGGNMNLLTQPLTSVEKTLIYDDKPALHKIFDLNYIGPGGGALEGFVNKSAPSKFTNIILYSIETR